MERLTTPNNKVVYMLDNEENIPFSVQTITPLTKNGDTVIQAPDEICFYVPDAIKYLRPDTDFVFCMSKKEAMNLVIAIEDLLKQINL